MARPRRNKKKITLALYPSTWVGVCFGSALKSRSLQTQRWKDRKPAPWSPRTSQKTCKRVDKCCKGGAKPI